jgi:valyl-tRNA synthetase
LPPPPRRATLRALFSKQTTRAMSEIPKTYEPPAIEAKWYAFWEQNGCFAADPDSTKPAYSIAIPPPNVTGVLTLGHVLNNTIQDILARRARMTGHEVLWLPGTDHAGIATQNVVEKTLRKEGVMKHRDDLGREALVGKIWEWKEKYGGIILKQLRALGASCDWSRTRFTMDEDYSRCVSRVFVDLYKKGLIYRGKRMVNWCPASLTALSDEEVIMKEQKGFMYHFRVEIAEEPGTFLTIATTRPETIPADTAVAVNPNDPRYTHLIGKHVYRALPLEVPKEQRRIPIIADDHVTFDFGTGVLKVTPAHDKADFEIGLRHKLPVIDVLTPDGRMTAEAGADLAGLDRFAARKKAHEILEAAGALEKAEPYVNNVGFSERADVPIEPRLSEQWFLKYPSVEQARACVVQPNESTKDTGSAGAPPAVPGASPGTSDVGRRPSHDSPATGNPTTPDASGEAPDAAGGAPALPSANARMRFFPDRWAKVYDHWLSGIQDWCISRQLWWGHRVPVWSGLMHMSGPELYETLFSRVALEVLSGTLPEALVETVIEIDGHKFSCTAENLKAQCDALGANRADHRVKVCTTNENFGNRFTSVGLDHDPDVLDTWFSSWLWPFATMGWPEKTETLAKFYPTTDLVTGPDIIFFWVARMIMAGFEWMGELPFKNVYFTGIIRDKQGRKMSKSLGNSPDPLDLIAKFGADALRFGVMRSAPLGSDILFDEKNVELGRNFCTKLWNAARFRQMQGGETEADIVPTLLTSDDKWILLRLDAAIAEVSSALTEYRFADAANALYRFFWSEYCDWYVEASKASLGSIPSTESTPSMDKVDDGRRANTLAVMDYVFSHTLRLFHPFMPFITEELWQGMGFAKDMPAKQGGETIMFAPWPKPFTPEEREYFILDESDEQFANAKYEVVNLGRGLRRDFNIASSKRVRFVLKPTATLADHETAVLQLLLNAEPLEVNAAFSPTKGTPVALTPLGELFLPLDGLIDVAAERERIGKEIAKADDELAKVRTKLADPNFAGKVPAKVLEDHQTRERDWAEKHAQLTKMREALGAS